MLPIEPPQLLATGHQLHLEFRIFDSFYSALRLLVSANAKENLTWECLHKPEWKFKAFDADKDLVALKGHCRCQIFLSAISLTRSVDAASSIQMQ